MFYPDFKEYKKLAGKGNLIPVYREILADMETPVSAFSKLDDSKYAYLLESVEGGEKQARYSFLSTGSTEVYESGKDPSSSLKKLEKIMSSYKPVHIKGLPRFYGGLVGYISYDMVSSLEDIQDKNTDELGLPVFRFILNDTTIIFDHVTRTIKVMSCVKLDGGKKNIVTEYRNACIRINKVIDKLRKPVKKRPYKHKNKLKLNIKSNFTKEEFKGIVEKAKAFIRAGDIIQAVLSQRFQVAVKSDPFDIYRALRVVNPSPYMYYLKMNDLVIAGSSPEILVRNEDRKVVVRPIAGTRKRGRDEAEDKRLEKELLADPKEKAEHIMLVDLGRNDIGRVCEYGSVKVSELMVIEKYSHVMHIVSEVTGKLRNNKNSFDVMRACFPAGTVSGAPKIRAMEIIAQLEKVKRGPYAGAVGYFSFQGNMDMAITIRTILVKNGKAYIQAGAGIVADSIPEKEYYETINKAGAMIKAVEMAERGLE